MRNFLLVLSSDVFYMFVLFAPFDKLHWLLQEQCGNLAMTVQTLIQPVQVATNTSED